ncbi:hypothetical protein MRBLRH8O_001854 [Agrobacterium radiobacter]|uniref:hypothetical protein n=1 Tax=Agrobacterium radiobacter TaxID=362 RepID=UPI003464FB5B
MKQTKLYEKFRVSDQRENNWSSFVHSHNSLEVAYGTAAKKVFFNRSQTEVYDRYSVPNDTSGWCAFVDTLDMDFGAGNSFPSEQTQNDAAFAQYSKLVEKLTNAIQEYIQHASEAHRMDVSAESTRNYFYLLPLLHRKKHEVSIDADTGFITVAFFSPDNSLMSALLTGKGDIHYSYVARGVKIVKISGVAKIKNSRDFGHFARVLRML